jgi:hydroxymethylpyrimidine/phosphomethylpyrimidine kinase
VPNHGARPHLSAPFLSLYTIMSQHKHYHRALTIAGSDSGGGAGIQADLKTFAANGCYGMSAITALTAQNTTGVSAIHPVPEEMVTAQLEAVLTDIGADAIKIGMLYSASLIRAVAEALRRFAVTNVVLDPVMVAQSGDSLMQDAAVAALKSELIPLATLITPNLPEAGVLLGRSLRNRKEIGPAARELAALGCANVLIKGGHLEEGDSTDWLYLAGDERLVMLPGERIATRNNHGTGCTLSSAITAHLARGATMEEAVRRGKEYITEALRAGSAYNIGCGHGPVHHFYRFF